MCVPNPLTEQDQQAINDSLVACARFGDGATWNRVAERISHLKVDDEGDDDVGVYLEFLGLVIDCDREEAEYLLAAMQTGLVVAAAIRKRMDQYRADVAQSN